MNLTQIKEQKTDRLIARFMERGRLSSIKKNKKVIIKELRSWIDENSELLPHEVYDMNDPVEMLRCISLSRPSQYLYLTNPTIKVEVYFYHTKKTVHTTYKKIKDAKLSDFSNEIDFSKKGGKLARFTFINCSTDHDKYLDLVTKNCKKIISRAVKIIKENTERFNFKKDVLTINGNEWNYVSIGLFPAAMGAWHDFHPGCCGFSEHNGVELGDYNRAHELADKLAEIEISKTHSVDLNDLTQSRYIDALLLHS